jgi:glycosyltransferase involved in cell wall biosynthesis
MECTAHVEAGKISVVHQHALWTGLSRVTSLLRERHGVPSVVTAHGALERWALLKSRWKKKIALALYEKNNLHYSSCLHACSDQEKEGFREYGLTNPIAVIPNGISNDWLQSTGDKVAFRTAFNIDPDKRILLYLSRIAPIKGIPLLIEALAIIRDKLSDWILILAGADESGHLREIQTLVVTYQLEKHVIFTGLLKDQLKRDAYAAAELFVLPTKREAAPVVVLEALGAGVPVITTKGAPWENLISHQCGWWADVDCSAIAEALESAMSCAPDELQRMGRRGKELVADKYMWENSARMTIELYGWLTGNRERPDFVTTY